MRTSRRPGQPRPSHRGLAGWRVWRTSVRDSSLEPDTPFQLPGVVVFYGTILAIVLGTFGTIASRSRGPLFSDGPSRPPTLGIQLDLMPLLEGGIRLAISLIYVRPGQGHAIGRAIVGPRLLR